MGQQKAIDLAQTIMKKGDAYYQERKISDALAAWEEALSLYAIPQLIDHPELDKDRAHLQINRGVALKSLRRHEEALEAYDAALVLYAMPHLVGHSELDRSRADLQMKRGIVLFSLRRYEEELEAYDAALTLHTLSHLADRPELGVDRARLQIARGSALNSLGHIEEGLEAYEIAVTLYGLPHLADNSEMDKDRALLQINLGMALNSFGCHEEALEAYDRALSLYALPHLARRSELDIHRARLQMSRGESLRSLGRVEEALVACDSAFTLHALPHLANHPELDKDRASLQMELGNALNSLGRLEEGVEAYERALTLHALPHLARRSEFDFSRALLQRNLGSALAGLGRLKDALKAYDRALSLYALPHLARRSELDINRARLQQELGSALNSLGRLEEGVEAYERALTLHGLPHLANRPELDIDRAKLQINWGIALRSLGRFGDALKACELAMTLYALPHLANRLELDKNRAYLQMIRGNALQYLGRHDEALEAYELAMALHALPHLANRPELDKDRADLQINRGNALKSLGRSLEAQKACELAMTLYALPHLSTRKELDKNRAIMQMSRGNALTSLGLLDEALDYYESALTLHALPHLADRPELDKNRAMLYVNMANLLPEMSDRDEFTDEASSQLAAMLELAPLPVENQYDPFKEIRHDFVRFHSRWLQHAIAQGWEDDIPRIMATIQGRDLAARMLDELETSAGMGVAPGAVQRYQQARLSLRKLRAQIDKIVSGGVNTSTENDDSGSRLPQGASLAQGQDAPNPELEQLREQYQTQHRELPKLRRTAAEEPGYGILAQPHRQITLDGLQSSLTRDEALVLLLDRGENAKKTEADGSVKEHPGTGAILNVETELPRRRGRARRHRPSNYFFVLFLSFVVNTLLRRRFSSTTLRTKAEKLIVSAALLRRRFSSATLRTAVGTEQVQSFHVLVIRSTGQRLISLPNLGPILKQMDSYLASQERKLADTAQTPSSRSMSSYRRGAEIDEETHSRAASGFTAGKQRLGDKSYAAFWQAQAERQAKHLWEPLSDALDGITTVITLSHGRLHGLPLEAGLPADKRLRSYPGVVLYAGRRGLLGDALKPAEVSSAGGSPIPPQPLGVLAYPGEGVKKIPRVEDEVQCVWQLRNQAEPFSYYPLQSRPPAVRSLHIASHGVPDKHGQVALQVGKYETLDMERILEQQIRAETVYLGCCLAGQTVEDLDGEPTGLITGFFLRGTKVLHGAVVEVNDEWAPLLGILYQRELHAGKASEMAMERAKEILRSGEWEPEEFGALAPKIEALYQNRRIPPEPILGDLLYGMRTFGEG